MKQWCFFAVLLWIACRPKVEMTPTVTAGTPLSDRSASAPVDSNYLLGKFDPTRHSDFVLLAKPYTEKPDMYLRREAAEAFKKMWAAAQKDGVTLRIVSATRTFARQREIWESKWTRFAAETPDPKARALRILEYSAMPGASRHHWGTDIDLNDLENHMFEQGGAHAHVYTWLVKNAGTYGFCQPYTPKNAERPHGYNEEKWHWSYLPVADSLLRQYGQTLGDRDFSGFSGAELAPAIGIVRKYVQGIAPACH